MTITQEQADGITRILLDAYDTDERFRAFIDGKYGVGRKSAKRDDRHFSSAISGSTGGRLRAVTVQVTPVTPALHPPVGLGTEGAA
jgi:hypothetical protein